MKLRSSCAPVAPPRCFTSALMRGSCKPSPSGEANTSTPRSGPGGATRVLKPIARRIVARSSCIWYSSNSRSLSLATHALHSRLRLISSKSGFSASSASMDAAVGFREVDCSSSHASGLIAKSVIILPNILRVALGNASRDTRDCQTTLRMLGWLGMTLGSNR